MKSFSWSTMRAFAIAPYLALALVLVLLSGCKDESKTSEPPAPPSPQYVIKQIERPDDSPEARRIYTYLPDGRTLVKLEIQLRDGVTQIQTFRKDQSISEVTETHPFSTKTKSVTNYAADGSTIVDKTTYRVNGILEDKTTFASDGSSTTLRYRLDGKRLHSRAIKTKGGDESITFFRQDGTTTWAKAEVKAGGDRRVEYFGADGRLQHIREVFSDHMMVTVFDTAGTPVYRQRWDGYRYSYSYYSYYTLEKVEEFAGDGSTVVRELEFQRYGSRNVTKARDFENGVKVRERSFRYDGTLESETTFNTSDGTSSVVNHDAKEGIKEKVDSSWSKEPSYEDPFSDNPANFY